MKVISTTNGGQAFVDDEDYEILSKHEWLLGKNGYVFRFDRVNGKRKAVYMHRVVNNTPEGMYTDHINGVTHDNTKRNLRNATKLENQRNQKSNYGTSKYKGVCWHGSGKWSAQITVNYKKKHLGLFTDEREAAKTYNAAAIREFGEYARLNEVLA